MRHLFVLLLAIGLVACGDQNQSASQTSEKAAALTDSVATQAANETETDRLNAWFEVKFEEELMQSPISLTFLGRKERYGEIDDVSESAEDALLEWKRKSIGEMKSSFDYEALTDDAKLSYDLWQYQYDEMAAEQKFRRNEYIFTQMQGTHTFFPTLMMSFHKVESLSDMEV